MSDQTITAALAELGVRHEQDRDSRRFLYAGDECIGTADAAQAWALARFLRTLRDGQATDPGADAVQRRLDGIAEYDGAARADLIGQVAP